jgi:hypothetical protein
MKYNLEKIQEIFEIEANITTTAKKYAELEGILYTDGFRRKLSNIINKNGIKPDDDFENTTETETNQYNMNSGVPMSALKEDGTIMDITEYCNFYNLPESQVKSYKIVTHQGKAAYYNIAFGSMQGDKFDEFYETLLKEIKDISTLPTSIKRVVLEDNKEEFLLVIDPADIHVGKLAEAFETGDEYNSNIAVQRTLEGVEGILNKVKGFPIDKILFIAGNDILHIDSPKKTTTSGTPQDTDGSWYSNFLIAKQLYIDILTRLLEVSDVHVSFNPSNHDWTHGFFLLDVVKTYFHKVDNISFDSDLRHRKYFTYHSNLIGTTHGDGAKMTDLPSLMAHEAEDWSKCRHRYVYTHHVHHKTSKDFIGVTIESLRSPSGTDGWHDRNGYCGVPKAIEGFLHSKTQGQIARITHIFF